MEDLENKELEKYIVDISEIDFDEVRKVYNEMQKEKEEREKLMTPEERENLQKMEEIDKICDKIMDYRIKREEMLNEMTTEESIEYYKEICKRADDFADETGMKSVTVDEIHNKK